MVERDLAKVDVAGPTPVSRSKAIRSNLNRLFFYSASCKSCVGLYEHRQPAVIVETAKFFFTRNQP